MGSTLKTDHLKLNKWISTDVPKRQDFVEDNEIIDAAVQTHVENENVHVSEKDREAWSSPYYIGFYYGNGALTRTVDTKCPFDPSAGFIFGGAMPPSITDFDNKTKYNYFGFLSARTSNVCLSLTGSNIVISTNGGAVVGGDYMNYNSIGVTYCYVLFR